MVAVAPGWQSWRLWDGAGTDRDAPSSNGKTSSPAQADGLLDIFFFIFFPERERRRAGIDLSSLPISLKFQINKIHFSAPLPSPLQQTKEKQFPAVCSKLLSSLPHPAPLPFQTLDPSRGWETPSSEGTQREHPGASKTALTAQGAAFPAPPSMGFAGSQQDPRGICCPHIPGQQRPATPRAPKSNILSTKFPRVLKL